MKNASYRWESVRVFDLDNFDKSESGGKWILVSHWLRILQILRISQWETSIYFPLLSDLSEHSFGVCRPNVDRISWNFEWYQFFILVGPGGNHATTNFMTMAFDDLTLSYLWNKFMWLWQDVKVWSFGEYFIKVRICFVWFRRDLELVWYILVWNNIHLKVSSRFDLFWLF